MNTYDPVKPITFSNIPLTGVLVPGTTVGYVVESRYIKGGYIVVKTVEDRDALLDTSIYEDRDVLVVGTPVFVSDENKTYRYLGNTGPDVWQEDTADMQQVLDNIDDLQKIALSQKAEIDQKASKEDLAKTDANVSDIQTIILSQKEEIDNKADKKDIAGIELDVDKLQSDLSSLQTIVLSQKTEIDGKADKSELENYYEKDQAEANLLWSDSRPVETAVGNIKVGDNLSGLTLKQILEMMFYDGEIILPTFEEPTISVEVQNAMGKAHEAMTITGTAHVDRGTIKLGDELQGYRMGKVTGVKVGDGIVHPVTDTEESQVEDIKFTYVVDNMPYGSTEIPVEVIYEAGPQPVDSVGRDYGKPYAAGSVIKHIEVTGIVNAYIDDGSGDPKIDNIGGEIITDGTSASKDKVGMFRVIDEEGNIVQTGYQITIPKAIFVPGSGMSSPAILLPAYLELIGIQTFDLMTDSWIWFRGKTAEESIKANSFIKSETTSEHQINHQKIPYYTYTWNTVACGAVGAQTLRFCIAAL